MKNYEVKVTGEIAGTWRTAGDIIPLTKEQAQYLAPPLATIVAPVEDAEDGGFSGRKRSHRKTDDGLGPRPAVNQKDPDDKA